MRKILEDVAGERHVMLDLETWGKRPGCDIRSIGAVEFNPYTGFIGERFYVNTLPAEHFGLVRDGETEDWWADQSLEAQAAFHDPPPVQIGMALSGLEKFYLEVNSRAADKSARLWSNGPSFDQAIIEHIWWRVMDRELPWRYNVGRDCRTIYDCIDRPWVDPVGTTHHALDDAIYQAKVIIEALRIV